MGFEKFEGGGQGRGGSTEPKISLRKSGSIGINKAALEEYFEDAEGAVMYYDEDENRVGIEPVDDADQEDTYTISRSNDTGAITPSAFLNRHNLVPEITTQYRPSTHTVNQNLELVVFEVGEDSDDFVGTYGSPASEESNADTAEADD